MDIIELANCHITQFTNKGVKGDWKVKDENGKTIDEMPKVLDERQAMKIIHFARKFELEAFNRGIRFGKNIKKPELLKDEKKKLLKVISELTDANTVLAEKLDKFTRVN